MTITKNSNIEWIGNVPQDWKIVRVKDKYNFNTGFTPPTECSEFYDNDKGYEWATITDMNNGQVEKTKSKISEKYITLAHPKHTRAGSLLYSFKLSIGQTAIVDRDIYTNEAIASFDPETNPSINFFKYSSSLIRFNANTNIYGASILNQQLINDAPIVFPPLKTQKSIANFLDKQCSEIDSLSSDIQSQIDILEEYKKSVITETVTKGLNPDVEMKDSGVEWIGKVPFDWVVEKGKHYFTNNKYIPGIKSSEYDRLALTLKGVISRPKDDSDGLQPKDFNAYQLLKENELVFKLIDLQNVSTSRVGLAHTTGLVSPAYIVLHAGDKILPEYAEKFYLMMWYREIFNALGDNGVRSNLGVSDLLNIPITIPPLEVQKSIAHFLDQKCTEIDEIIASKRAQLETLAEYKKSLIYEYVTGKKEVPDVF